MSAREPLSASSQFIQADDDDDDLDEDSIPGFSQPSPSQNHSSPLGQDKGKARAQPEQLAAPSNGGRASNGNQLSGNIGSNNAPKAPNRQTLGGVQVESRYVCLSIFPLI